MIIGKHIRLRAAEREDIPRFVAWLNDPEVIQNLSLILPMSFSMEETWFESMLKSPGEEHPLVIEIETEEGWQPVGNVSFMNINWRCRSAEIGIFIGEKRWWNQGYGQKVMRRMLRHGFETLNLHRIYLRVYETNLRGIRAYEKAGFVHEGRARQAEFRNGRYMDVLWMSALQNEWQDASE